MDEQKRIDALRKFFRISVAAFDMMDTISRAFGYKCQVGEMHKLHIAAKSEIEKDNPNMELMDRYLESMEKQTENQ